MRGWTANRSTSPTSRCAGWRHWRLWSESITRRRRAGRRERDDRNDPRRLAFVVGESRILLRLLRVLLVALGALQLDGMHVDDVVADLDAGVRIGFQIPVPGGIAVGTGVGGKDQISVAVSPIHHDVGPRLPAASTDGVQDDQRSTLEVAADPTVIRAEFGDVALVEVFAVAHLRHSSSSLRSASSPARLMSDSLPG